MEGRTGVLVEVMVAVEVEEDYLGEKLGWPKSPLRFFP